MNTRNLFVSVLISVCVLLSACTSQGTPTPAPVPTQPVEQFGKEVVNQMPFKEPRGLVNGFGSIWLNIYEDTLYRFDPETTDIQATIVEKIGQEPARMVVTDNALWVMNAASRSISRVDPNTNQVTEGFEFSDICCNLAVYDGGVYSINGDKTLSRIDPGSNEVTEYSYPSGQLTGGPFSDESGLWVEVNGTTIQAFEATTETFGKAFQHHGEPIGVYNGLFYSASDESVTAVDTQTGEVKATIPADGEKISKFGFTSAVYDFHQQAVISGNDLWIIGEDPTGNYLLIKINLDTQKVEQRILVGHSPGGFVSMVVDGNTIWLLAPHDQLLKIKP